MKGILLAGGRGTRLWPIAESINKHLLPIYSKPMIYYSISTLMLGGIRDILLISTPDALPSFRAMFGDGSSLGLTLRYAEQPEPTGIADAFEIAGQVMEPSPVTLILGDNVFFGANMQSLLVKSFDLTSGARIFGYHVEDPRRFGVISLDAVGRAKGIVEKPANPASTLAATGLYVYDAEVFDIARGLSASGRGEKEITAVNSHYIERGCLDCVELPRGTVWIDAGTIDSLAEASDFVRMMERRTHTLVCAPEEVALAKGFITGEEFDALISGKTSGYYTALRRTVRPGLSAGAHNGEVTDAG